MDRADAFFDHLRRAILSTRSSRFQWRISMTIVDALRPAERMRALAFNATAVIGGSIFIALSAQISFFLPFSPVPVTGQTFAILLIGALFGAKLGTAAVLAYLVEGASGLPVFSAGGATVAHLIGPSGGYLIGFVGTAWLVGALAERGWTAHPVTTAVAMIIGATVYFAVGAAWLALFVGAKNAAIVGIVPFLLGDALKIALAAIILPLATRFVTRR